MKIILSLALLSVTLFSAQNCSEKDTNKVKAISSETITAQKSPSTALPEGFNAYWYAGKAEISSYNVTQERYGEIRQAEQVNIFVTEDFSASKQVKLDNPAGGDPVPVLKLNSIRRFHTGIYDYSIMQSSFTPINGSSTIKTTTSIQDWCGQVFIQNNLTQDGYRNRTFSYFETEADRDLNLPLALLEDELWTRIRLNPSAIKTGKISIIPSSIYTRLRHQDGGVKNAELQIEQGEKESFLKLKYTDIPRSLNIRFTTAFPHNILSWEEFQDNKITSKGELKATRNSAYWSEHDNIHAPLRDSLKLQF
jgi:hypothetical protein